MTIRIIHEVHVKGLDSNGDHNLLHNVFQILKSIKHQNQQIMATISELTQKVDALQTQVTDFQDAVNTEQQQVTDAINALNQTIADLQAIVASGGTEAERQALADKLTDISTGLQTAKDDLASTIADTPGPENGGEQPV